MIAVALAVILSASTPAPVANRYAVLISANVGDDNETPLHYAATDASRLAQLLQDYGDFPANHVWVLRQPMPQDVSVVLAQIGALRRSEGQPLEDSLLFVYYAGHADPSTMHLGPAHMLWPELIAATRKAGVKQRVLVVDACRSGADSSGLPEHHLEHSLHPEQLGELAIFSAVSADERSRESDAVGGALFTHHLLSALQGAGDINGDGKVNLYEALAYSAARTAPGYELPVGGAEEASHRYRLVGHGDAVLTAPSQVPSLATLHLAAPGTYVIRHDTAQGAVALQAVVNAAVRTLWLPAGRYFVERRTGHTAYEGSVDLAPSGGAMIEDDTFVPALETRSDDHAWHSPFEHPATMLSVGAGAGGRLMPDVSVPWAVHGLLAHRRDAMVLDLNLQWSQSPALHDGTALQDAGAAFGIRGATDLGPLMLSVGVRAGARYLDLRTASQNEHRFAPQAAAVVRADLIMTDHLFAGLEGGVNATFVGNNAFASTPAFLWQPIGTLDVGVIF